MVLYDWVVEGVSVELQCYVYCCLVEDVEQLVIEIEVYIGSGLCCVIEVKVQCVEFGGWFCVVLMVQDFSDICYVQNSLLDVGWVFYQIIENNLVVIFVIDKLYCVMQWNVVCVQFIQCEVVDMIGCDDVWCVFYFEFWLLLVDFILDDWVEVDGECLYGWCCNCLLSLVNVYEVEGYFFNFGCVGCWLFFMVVFLFDIYGQIVGVIEMLQDVMCCCEVECELCYYCIEFEKMIVDCIVELLSIYYELEVFFENVLVGIIVIVNWQIQCGNKKFVEMFEFGDRFLYGLLMCIFFKSDEDYEVFSQLVGVVLLQGGLLLYEMEVCMLVGNMWWVQIIVYIVNLVELILGIWWLLQDCIEVCCVQCELELNYECIKQINSWFEEVQNQLLQLEKMVFIGQLVVGVVYEINNFIGFVSFNLGLLCGYVELVFVLFVLLKVMFFDVLLVDVREEFVCFDDVVDLVFVQEDLFQLLVESEDGLLCVKKIVQDLKDFLCVDYVDWQDVDINVGFDLIFNVVMNEVKYKVEICKDYQVLLFVYCIVVQFNQVFMNFIVNVVYVIFECGMIMLVMCV